MFLNFCICDTPPRVQIDSRSKHQTVSAAVTSTFVHGREQSRGVVACWCLTRWIAVQWRGSHQSSAEVGCEAFSLEQVNTCADSSAPVSPSSCAQHALISFSMLEILCPPINKKRSDIDSQWVVNVKVNIHVDSTHSLHIITFGETCSSCLLFTPAAWAVLPNQLLFFFLVSLLLFSFPCFFGPSVKKSSIYSK